MIKNKKIRTVVNVLMWTFASVILFNYSYFGMWQLVTGSYKYLSLVAVISAAVVLPIAALLLFGKKIRRTADILQLIFVIGMGIYCVTFVISIVYTLCGVQYEPQSGYDGIIVYGAKVNGSEPSKSLKERLDKALEVYEKNPDACFIVTGGQGNGESISEAECMKNYLVRCGVDASVIFCEDRSTDTKQNVEYSKKLLEEHGLGGIKTVGVSSEFHVKRIQKICRANGLDTDCVGTHTSNPARLYLMLVREYMSNIKYMLGV